MLITFLLLPFLALANPCLEHRAAVDIGSGSTKALVAEVDTCKKQVGKTLFEEQLPLPFAEAFEKNGKTTIPDSFVSESLPKFRVLAAKIAEHKPTKSAAVLTSTFRQAKNGKAVARKIARALGFPARVISQDEEAHLGYLSALAERPARKGEKIVVWDIGGGSMQITDGKKTIRGHLASVSFKNRVIQEIQKKDPKITPSPNPLNESAEKAVALAKAHAGKNVPQAFKKPKTTWLGLGGVLGKSLPKQIGKSTFTLTDIQQTLKQQAQKTDAEIGGDYASTDGTNLALVAGYMESLRIERIETVKASLEKGALLEGLKR